MLIILNQHTSLNFYKSTTLQIDMSHSHLVIINFMISEYSYDCKIDKWKFLVSVLELKFPMIMFIF
jgi:hypothetical protein